MAIATHREWQPRKSSPEIRSTAG